MTDGESLEAHLRGDPQAFADLVARYAPMVHGVAARRAPGHEQDVTQAVFLLLHQRAAALRQRRNLAGWLYLAARLCARTALRAEGRRQKHEREAGRMRTSTPSENDMDGVTMLLDDALGALRQGDREVVILHFLQNRSLGDAATALGLSEAATAKRCQRAIERLRQWFGMHGHVLPTAAISAVFAAEALRPAPAVAAAWTAGTSSNAVGLAKAAHVAMITKKALVGATAAVAMLISLSTAALLKAPRDKNPPIVPVALPTSAPAAVATTSASAPRPAVFAGTAIFTSRRPGMNGQPLRERLYVQQPDRMRIELLNADGKPDSDTPPQVMNGGMQVHADDRSHLYLIEPFLAPDSAARVNLFLALATLKREGGKLPMPGGEIDAVLEPRAAAGEAAAPRFEVLRRTPAGNVALENIGQLFVTLDARGAGTHVELVNPQKTQYVVDVELKSDLPPELFELKAPAGYTDVRDGIRPRLTAELRDILDHYRAARDAFDHYRMAVLRNGYPRGRNVRDGNQWRIDEPDLGPLMADVGRFKLPNPENADPTTYLDRIMTPDVKLYSLAMTYQGKMAHAGWNYSTDDGGPQIRADWLLPPAHSMFSSNPDLEPVDERLNAQWLKQLPSFLVGSNISGNDLRQLAWPAWKGEVLIAPFGWDLGTPPHDYYRLPRRDSQPNLVGIRAVRQTEATDYWIDAQHDYLCVEYDHYFDPEMPWKKDPVAWNPADEYAHPRPVTPNSDPSHESQKIVGLARTAAGKWYPKQVNFNGGRDSYFRAVILLDTPAKADPMLFKWPQGTPQPGTTPVVQGKTITVSPGSPELKELQLRQATETNMRAIMNAMSRYHDREHRWPADLQVLVDGNYLTKESIANPHGSGSFAFAPNRAKDLDPVVWEAYTRWPTQSVGKDFPAAIAVGRYGDVKWVETEAEFQKTVEGVTGQKVPAPLPPVGLP